MRLVSTPAPIQVTGGARRLRRGLVAFLLIPVIVTIVLLKLIVRGIIAIVKAIIAMREGARLDG